MPVFAYEGSSAEDLLFDSFDELGQLSVSQGLYTSFSCNAS